MSLLNYFTILGLSTPNLSPQNAKPDLKEIKAAYRRSLLKYHPDKLEAQESLGESDSTNEILRSHDTDDKANTKETQTIDLILEAFRVLSAPGTYRRHLTSLHSRREGGLSAVPEKGKLIVDRLEVVDLDDMRFVDPDEGGDYDVDEPTYIYDCRCGHLPGYAIAISELEKLSDDLIANDKNVTEGHVVVECHGCSLAIYVEFVIPDQDQP